ncbi:MAG: DUF268 domain-containing protein [Planctomycetaceae bacterium]
MPKWQDRWLIVDDRTSQTPFDRHYVYHTAWAVRQLRRFSPHEHVDVSSAIYFVALGSAVVPIRHIDFRPPQILLDNVECEAGDVTALRFEDASLDSLSCMHVIEHIGLGRYGDSLDPLGDLKAAAELQRVLAPGGRLLFVTPVGQPRITFNAHRIYSFEMVARLFPKLALREWMLIPDDTNSGPIEGASPALFDQQKYACGCFIFERSPSPIGGLQ